MASDVSIAPQASAPPSTATTKPSGLRWAHSRCNTRREASSSSIASQRKQHRSCHHKSTSGEVTIESHPNLGCSRRAGTSSFDRLRVQRSFPNHMTCKADWTPVERARCEGRQRQKKNSSLNYRCARWLRGRRRRLAQNSGSLASRLRSPHPRMRIELSRERLRVKVAQRRGRNEGQGLVEHALILGLIAVLAASVIVLISEHSSRKLAGVRAPMTSQ